MGVRMTHPVSGGEYDAQPSQVEHLKETGWELAEGEEADYERWPADLQRYGGQPEVQLRHPVTGAEYGSPESAVPYHQEKGWVRADEQADQALEDKTVPELRDLAKEQGIKPIPATKPELIAALSSTTPSDQAGEDDAGAEPAQDSEEGE